MSLSVIQSYGPLALLLYTRVLKLSKENADFRELRVVAIISAAQLSGRRRDNLDEIHFLQKILEFFNFNVCLAKRDAKSQARLKLLMSIIPSIKELAKVFN